MSALEIESVSQARTVDLILMGAPGSGKGTQSAFLARTLKIPHIATGDIIRKEMSENTPLGRKARAFYDRGDLVPDEVVIGIIAARLQEPDSTGGFLLDGFPRTIPQADALDLSLGKLGRELTATIYLDVPREELVRRLSGRWICRKCGRSHHLLFDAPRQLGICNHCGGELYQRPDDSAKTALHRIDVYQAETRPLLAYYAKRGLLRQVRGLGSIEQVSAEIRQALAE